LIASFVLGLVADHRPRHRTVADVTARFARAVTDEALFGQRSSGDHGKCAPHPKLFDKAQV
jgi:hypothetical protein